MKWHPCQDLDLDLISTLTLFVDLVQSGHPYLNLVSEMRTVCMVVIFNGLLE